MTTSRPRVPRSDPTEWTTLAEPYDGPWQELPVGTIWCDSTGQKWRRIKSTRLKVGGSHPGVTGPKPQIIRMQAREDLAELLPRIKALVTRKGVRNRDVLAAIKLLHQIGGMQSIALLNADGDDATIPPLVFEGNAPPPREIPVSPDSGPDHDGRV